MGPSVEVEELTVDRSKDSILGEKATSIGTNTVRSGIKFGDGLFRPNACLYAGSMWELKSASVFQPSFGAKSALRDGTFSEFLQLQRQCLLENPPYHHMHTYKVCVLLFQFVPNILCASRLHGFDEVDRGC